MTDRYYAATRKSYDHHGCTELWKTNDSLQLCADKEGFCFISMIRLCVQCMHIGSYDDEPATIKSMVEYAQRQGYQIAIDNHRRHHEIYLGDPRKTSPDKLKTVIRYSVK